jgi:hypothetical protein
MGGACSARERRRNLCFLVREREGKWHLGRHRRRWEDNIEMELRKIGLEDVNWNHLVGSVNTVMNIRFL